MDMNQMLTGPVPQQPQQGPNPNIPSAANPGGLPAPSDPLDYGFSVGVTALKQLSQQLAMAGDEMAGNEVDQMANKLNKRRLKRKEELQQAMEAMQGQQLAAQL